MADDDLDLMTPDELCAAFKLRKQTLANQRSRGDGPPFIKLGRRTVRYDRAAVAAWLQERRVEAAGA